MNLELGKRYTCAVCGGTCKAMAVGEIGGRELILSHVVDHVEPNHTPFAAELIPFKERTMSETTFLPLEPAPSLSLDQQLRITALDQARMHIDSQIGRGSQSGLQSVYSPENVVTAAEKFYAFLAGTADE